MMLDWDWKERSTKWLKRRLQYVKDELDDGECTPCRIEEYQRQERVIQRELDRRSRVEGACKESLHAKMEGQFHAV